MAHSEHTKAQVLALLMLGNSPRYVAEQTGVPLTTVRRWQPEALGTWGEIAPELAELAQGVATLFPGLFNQNGPKKEKTSDAASGAITGV